MEDGIYTLLVAVAVIFVIIVIVVAIRFFRSRPVGSPCASNTDCNSGLVCDTAAQVCRIPVGTACLSNTDCTSNATCVSGICTVTPTTPITGNGTANNANNNLVPVTMPALSPIIFDYHDSCDTSLSSSFSAPPRKPRRRWERDSSLSTSSLASSIGDSETTTESSEDARGRYPHKGRDTTETDYRSSGTTETDLWSPPKKYSRSPSTVPQISSYSPLPASPSGGTPTISGVFGQQKLRETSSASMSDRLLDIVDYDGEEMMLQKNGDVFYSQKKYKSDTAITRLECLGDHVYGLSHGTLHALKTPSLSGETLRWTAVKNTPRQIKHTSSTRNGSHLWLQTANKGFLYNNRLELVEDADCPNFIRNLGHGPDHYIDSYPQNGNVKIYKDGEEFEKDCAYAIFDDEADGIVTCNSEDWQIYKDIRLTTKSSYLIAR